MSFKMLFITLSVESIGRMPYNLIIGSIDKNRIVF